MRRAFSSALGIFCRHGSLCAIRRLLAGQYTPEPVVFPTPFSSGGINDPSVSMHCWGLNLRGWVWYSSIGSCCVEWVFSWCSYIGALCHACDSFNFFLEGVFCCGCILAWVL